MILKSLFNYIEVSSSHDFVFINKSRKSIFTYKKYKCKHCDYIIWINYTKMTRRNNKIRLYKALYCDNFGKTIVCGNPDECSDNSGFIGSCKEVIMRRACE